MRSFATTSPSISQPKAIEHVVDREKRVGNHHSLRRRMRDVALVPERDVLEADDSEHRGRHARARRFALRQPGSACEASPTSPSGPCQTALAPRATSVRARWRISSANLSSDDDGKSECVPGAPRGGLAEGSGSSSARVRGRAARTQSRSSSGSVAAYVPTAPDSFPARMPSSARARRVTIPVELECPASELQSERRRLGVHAVCAADLQRAAVLLRPRDDDRECAVEGLGEHERPGLADLERQRGVDDVG